MDTYTYIYVKRTRCSFNFNYYVLLVFLLFVASCKRDQLSDPYELNETALEIKAWLASQKELPGIKMLWTAFHNLNERMKIIRKISLLE